MWIILRTSKPNDRKIIKSALLHVSSFCFPTNYEFMGKIYQTLEYIRFHLIHDRNHQVLNESV